MWFSFLLAHFIPYKRVPGSLWAGKQRKIPRLTASRKIAFMDEMLVTQQNERYLSKAYITPEAEAMVLPEEQVNPILLFDFLHLLNLRLKSILIEGKSSECGERGILQHI